MFDLGLELGPTRVKITLNVRIRCKTDMVVKAEDEWKWDSPKKTVRCNYPGVQMFSGRRLSWIPLKVLLYDDLIGVITSHVTKMAVTPLDPPWP